MRDPVFMKPVGAAADFSLPRDKDKLSYCRVLLLFQLRLRTKTGIKVVDCAFVQYFDKFLSPGKVYCVYGLCVCVVHVMSWFCMLCSVITFVVHVVYSSHTCVSLVYAYWPSTT
jgi:hypothetical protein